MFEVDRSTCIACMQCIRDCPTGTISLVEGKAEINNKGCIKCGHCVAICPVAAVSTDDYDMSEVIPYNKETFSIEPERLMNFIKFRRSIRRFKKKPVEREKILQIIEAGRFTQTSTNSQDVCYTIVTKQLDELREKVYERLKLKGEAILANLTPETMYLERYAKAWTMMYASHKEDPEKYDKLLFHAPLVILVSAKNSFNGILASSNMELMIDALGLGTFFSGFTMVAASDDPNFFDFLGIENSKEVVSCFVIGYPDAKYQRTVPRKEACIQWK